MRLIIALPLMSLVAGCNVTKDGNAVTVQYDQNTAENAVADVSNTAQDVAADIGNDVKATGDKIDNKVGNDDDNVNVNADVKTENKQ
jgi:predicted small secreted protein